ncbi:hypothetical protein C8R43DRAFT_1192863 [Mycena crocata]|nr:hypothetical protein C8R43DRAFT_1192863 [Mycena crocata]
MHSKFTFNTTAEELATIFADEITAVLITGTSLNGIGFEAARVIAEHANLVIITGYDEERLKLSQDALIPSANIRRLILDLSSLATRKLENQIATDHVGAFLILHRSLQTQRATHKYCDGVDLSVITKPDPATYNSAVAYAQAKSANILTTIELAKRGRGKLNPYSTYPGSNPLLLTLYCFSGCMMAEPTNIHLFQSSSQILGVLDENGQPSSTNYAWKTIPEGAATTVAAAFDPSLNDASGSYLSDSQVATSTVALHSSDPAMAEKLWNHTEEITGKRFAFWI